MDEIRRARLARLQGSAPERAPQPAPEPAPERAPQRAPQPASERAPERAEPAPQRAPQPAPQRAEPAPQRAPEPAPQRAPEPAPEHTPERAPQPAPARPAISDALAYIFPTEELPPGLEPPSLETIETFLWTAIHICPDKFQFLASAQKRLRTCLRTHQSKESLLKIERAIASFGLISATSVPHERCYDSFSKWLLDGAREFSALLVEYAIEQDLLPDLLGPVWAKFRSHLVTVGIKGSYGKLLSATNFLLSYRPVAYLVASYPRFSVLPSATPHEIATETWLGPYLTLSPLDGDFAYSITFAGIDDIRFENSAALKAIENAMPEARAIMENLFNICDKLARAGAEPRRALLNFFTALLNRNNRRMASYVDSRSISTDGVMANATYIMVKFCGPIVDFSGSKLDKIDPAYYRNNCAYDIQEETKLVADLEESKKTLGERVAALPNFATQVFFLAVGFMHFGLGGIYTAEVRLRRVSRNAMQHLEEVDNEIQQLGSSDRAQYILNHIQVRTQMTAAAHLALSIVIRNQPIMATFYEFAAFTEFWTLSQAQPTYPRAPLSFVDSPPATPLFRSLPEHIVESYVATMTYVGQAMPQVARNFTNLPIVEGLIFYMECPEYIKNPYLKSQMVEVLFYGILRQSFFTENDTPGYFEDLFYTNPLCHEHLFHALMKIYVDMELTGRSAQFYEKFHTREIISQIMLVLWVNPIYQNSLMRQSKHNEEFFVKFTALLLNDSTYTLDEALGMLQEIRRLQHQIAAEDPQAQPEPRPSEDDEENQTPAEQLASAEDRAKQYLSLSKGCIDLLYTFTATAMQPFTRPEVVDRLVSMLDYNLNALVGPKCSELKVDDPEKYGFAPRQLLANILRIFLNLRSSHEFIDSVARDSESFGVEIFGHALETCKRHKILRNSEFNLLSKLVTSVEAAIKENELDEQELGEIPDEFLDPLMCTLMKDPVRLPSSGTTVDLTTIKSYLLNTPSDPFNRVPLKLEDVVPNEELKQQIEDYKREKRAQRN